MLSEFKNQVSKLKNDIGLITGLVAIATGLVTSFTELLKSEIVILVLIAGLFIILLRVFQRIQTAHKFVTGQKIFTYPEEKRKNAKRMVLVLWIIGPLSIISFIGYTFFYKKYTNKKNLGIIITKFNDTKNDSFSNDLFTLISRNENLRKSDTIKTIKHDKFIAFLPVDNLETITGIFDENYFTHGLVVFGERAKDEVSNKNILRCIVYINKLKNLMVDTTKVDMSLSDESVIYIRNPKIIDLGPDLQAKEIADFIIALLYRNAGQINPTREFLTAAINTASEFEAQKKKFIAQCRLLLGGSYIQSREFDKALEEYKKGVTTDSTLAYLHYNMAVLNLLNKDSAEASKHFKTAFGIDSLLENPIPEFTKRDPVGLSSNTLAPISNTVLPKNKPSAANLNSNKDQRKNNQPVVQNTVVTQSVAPTTTTVVKTLTDLSSPQICKEVIYHLIDFDMRDLTHKIVFFDGNQKKEYYVNGQNDIIMLIGDMKYQRVGRLSFVKGPYQVFQIKDFCGNTWQTDANDNILSSKGKVGDLFFKKIR